MFKYEELRRRSFILYSTPGRSWAGPSTLFTRHKLRRDSLKKKPYVSSEQIRCALRSIIAYKVSKYIGRGEYMIRDKDEEKYVSGVVCPGREGTLKNEESSAQK